MPRISKWLGDAIETVLATKYLTVTVKSTEHLTPGVRKVSFEGDFSSVNFQIGYAVSFRVNENDHRNYTPSYFDPEKGICEIIFHLHGNGPGSAYIDNLKTGDELKIFSPRGREFYQKDKQFHIMFGDETAIGLFHSLMSAIKQKKQHYVGIVELDEENLTVAAKIGLELAPVLKSPQQPAKNTVDSLNLLQTTLPEFFHNGMFYLAGNTSSIQVLKKTLKEMGVNIKNIKTQAYWAIGKTGL